MKKTIYYISILFALLITACSNEDIPVPTQTENGEEICKLTFKITIPQPSVASRAFNDGSTIDITSLCLLMFDEDGLMVGRKLAESVSDPTLQNGVYQGTYEVELAKTDENRIIHFVANYSTNIDDFPNSGNENSVLSQLNVIGTTDVYWQRIEVNGFRDTDNKKGDDNKYTIDNITETVRLIRNFVAVKMEPAKDDNENLLIADDFLQGYVLYNEAKQGTVAPYFRNENGGFANYTTGISYSNLVDIQKYIGVEPVEPTTGRYDATTPEEGDFTMSEKYTYERSYPTDELDSPTFIVMKGKYNGKDYYYRVDIAENFKNLHLLRNFRYILQITRTCEGYTTIADAINGSSFNHLVDINIKVEEITDGETTLKVTPTDITVVNGTENVTVEYTCTYKGTGTGTQPTVSVSSPFTPEIDKTREFIKSISKPSGMSGTLTVTLNSLFKDGASLLGNGIERQRFEVRTSNGLVREVRINLIDKIDFNPKFVGPDGDGNYQYQYNLPRDLPECMFPLEIYLYEETGSFTPASGEQLSVDLIPDPNNKGRQTWRYKKVMTYADYTADVDKNFIAKFRANGTLSGTATYTMHITNKYANDGKASLRRATIITIQDGDTELVWYIGDASSNQTATVTINNADVKWWYNALENFNITPALDENNFTGNKTFTISPKSMDTEVTETLTVTTADGMTDELVLKVVNEPTTITVRKNLKITISQFMGNSNVTEGLTITSSNSNVTITNLTYSQNGNWTFDITYKKGDDATITFATRYNYGNYTNSITLNNLLNPNTTSINLTYSW